MIQMPLQDMIKKITEEAGISEQEVNDKIKQKLEQLSGLISKEGAVHIIANELGVKLIPETTGRLDIKNILEGMREVEVAGKVTQNFGIREFKTDNREGKVANIVIADETGTIRVVCWGDQADKTANIDVGDVVKVSSGYVRLNQGNNEIHLNDRSVLTKNPEGIEINLGPSAAIRKKIEALSENDNNAEILGTIVQVFDPKFFEVCPECGKRSKPAENGAYSCPVHGEIKPNYSYLLNAYLDDGTGNIQAVFFRNLVESLLGKNAEEIMAYKDNPSAVEQLKTDLLGNIIKVLGRVNKNTMFERLEFVVQSVDTNPNPDDELKLLEKEKESVEAQTVTEEVQ